MREALDAGAPVDHEIVRYPDAKHGFHCDARPDAFNAEAAADGWARAIQWLREHVSLNHCGASSAPTRCRSDNRCSLGTAPHCGAGYDLQTPARSTTMSVAMLLVTHSRPAPSSAVSARFVTRSPAT